jgi:hypothetical protein
MDSSLRGPREIRVLCSRDYHDPRLSCGAPPVRFARPLLLDELIQ